jgi:hypothetical protein
LSFGAEFRGQTANSLDHGTQTRKILKQESFSQSCFQVDDDRWQYQCVIADATWFVKSLSVFLTGRQWGSSVMVTYNAFRLVSCGILLAILISGSGPALAQTPKAAPAGRELGKSIVLTSSGWPIHATYFEATPSSKEAPVVILIPGAEGHDVKDARNRRVWEKTATDLQRKGYAVVTVDLRKHGDSLPAGEPANSPNLRPAPGDYELMAASDLEAVKEFLLAEHENGRLNVRKLGIVAVGSSAMVAAAFTIGDWLKKPFEDAPTPALKTPRGQDVRALMMISPKITVKGLNTTALLRNVKTLPVAVNILASSSDKQEARDADKVFKAVDLKLEGCEGRQKADTCAGGCLGGTLP